MPQHSKFIINFRKEWDRSLTGASWRRPGCRKHLSRRLWWALPGGQPLPSKPLNGLDEGVYEFGVQTKPGITCLTVWQGTESFMEFVQSSASEVGNNTVLWQFLMLRIRQKS